MSIRVDLDAASRDELVAEIQRLDAVNDHWSDSWEGIVKANSDAWADQVRVLQRAVEALKTVVEHLPDDVEVPSAYVVAAQMALANIPIALRTK